MNESLQLGVKGTLGFAASTAAPNMLSAVDISPESITQLITQLVILISTIYALFKKKKVD